MEQKQDAIGNPQLSVRNVGGIDETEVVLSDGVTVLSGRNATNRTSLLQALMAALGSGHVSLKGDAERGRAKLTFDGETYDRTLVRTNDGVRFDGSPFLDDDTAEVADLFAFLLESNEARRTVAQQQNLHELITRPIDTEALQTKIEQLEQEKRRIDDELEEIDALERRLPELERERNRLESEIADKRNELASREAKIEDTNGSVDETQEIQTELDEKLDQLQEMRARREELRLDVESTKKSLDALRTERAEVEAALTDVDPPEKPVEEIEDEIRRLRDRRQSVESTLNELQSVIQFNEEMLAGTSADIAATLAGDAHGGDETVTDQLMADSETVVCWTCGTEVETDQIETTLDRLRDLRQEKVDARNSLTEKIAGLEDDKQDHEAIEAEHDRLERKVSGVQAEIESREALLAELQQSRDELEDEIAQLEDAIAELEAEEHDELLELHKQANQLEFELGRLEGDLEDVEAEIESIESRLDERNELEKRREEVGERLDDCRSRIERLEADTVEQFNEHMATVLDILEYENIDRVWIERVDREVREGQRKVTRGSFDLHVVRSTESGTTYEDTIDHLSESEREVTGLIFALAGYLVHEVHEELPFVVLDSLEAIDSGRIATLVDYLSEYAEYLVVALLPEDATALDTEHRRLTEI
jgi:DNA repair exonuclease SbcCD ATPase subunit